MNRDEYLQQVQRDYKLLADPKKQVAGLAGFWLLLIGQAYDQGRANAATNTDHKFLPLPKESK